MWDDDVSIVMIITTECGQSIIWSLQAKDTLTRTLVYENDGRNCFSIACRRPVNTIFINNSINKKSAEVGTSKLKHRQIGKDLYESKYFCPNVCAMGWLNTLSIGSRNKHHSLFILIKLFPFNCGLHCSDQYTAKVILLFVA